MLYLYLDESGDLGFDFVNKNPSRFFTITVLVVSGQNDNRSVINAVKQTLKRKLKKKKLLKQAGCELKASKVSVDVKKYFYAQIADIDFRIYALTLNKKRVYQHLIVQKERIYNYIARLVLDRIDFHHADTKVHLILDKSKAKPEIEDFNAYIFRQIQAKIDPKIPLPIQHALSHESPGLQAVDLFAWGIFRKHERKDREWFDVFRSKVVFDDLYLP